MSEQRKSIVFVIVMIVAAVVGLLLLMQTVESEAQADYRVLMLTCDGQSANLMWERMPGFGSEADARAYADGQFSQGYDLAYVYARRGNDLDLVRLREVGATCFGGQFSEWSAAP